MEIHGISATTAHETNNDATPVAINRNFIGGLLSSRIEYWEALADVQS
jgi:hypothetical protein